MNKVATVCLLAIVAVLVAPVAQAQVAVQNPDWELIISDFGYSDLLLDRRAGYEGREYLSGEWGAAVSYQIGGVVRSPIWLEPNFIFPNWTTNSDFGVITPIAVTGVNGQGLPIANSSISNPDLRIDIRYEMIDTTTGIEQGRHPASWADPGSSVTSNRYILQQTYTITNISNQTITDLQAFQFLHSLNALTAIYDDRNYGGPYAGYQFDTFETGVSWWGEEILEDVVTFHSALEPTAWEVGFYGRQTVDDHATAKPSVGVHLSIEANALSGLDFFDPAWPDDLWVSGAQRYDLISLAPDQSTSFDVLLSIDTTAIPEPSIVLLAGCGALLLWRRRKA